MLQLPILLRVLAGCLLFMPGSIDLRADEKAVTETSKVDDPNVKLTAGTWKDVESLIQQNSG